MYAEIIRFTELVFYVLLRFLKRLRTQKSCASKEDRHVNRSTHGKMKNRESHILKNDSVEPLIYKYCHFRYSKGQIKLTYGVVKASSTSALSKSPLILKPKFLDLLLVLILTIVFYRLAGDIAHCMEEYTGYHFSLYRIFLSNLQIIPFYSSPYKGHILIG